MLRLPSRARGAGLGAAGLGPGGEAGFGAAATGQSHSRPARPGPAKVSSSGEPGHSVGTDSAPRPGLRERVSLQLAAHERPREDEEAPRAGRARGCGPASKAQAFPLNRADRSGHVKVHPVPPVPPVPGVERRAAGQRPQGPGRGVSPRAGGAGPGPPPCTSALAAPGVPAGPFRDSRRHAAQPPAAGRPGPRTRGRRGATAARTRHPPPFGGSVLALRPLPARWRPGDRAPHLASEGGAQAEGEADPKAGSSAAGSR